jgi:hypothetical protein
MSLLAKWTWARPLRAVEEALAGVPTDAMVALIHAAPLAGLLAPARRVVVVDEALAGRAARRVTGRGVRGRGAALPLADAGLAALVGAGGALGGESLGEWARVVRDGGLVVVVDRAAPEEQTRRMLDAHLVDLEQRAAGRLTVTSGRVRRW